MLERIYLRHAWGDFFPWYSSSKGKNQLSFCPVFLLTEQSSGKYPLSRGCTYELMIPDTFSCEVVSWEYFATLARTPAYRIKQSGFRPDLVIAIGRGGYVPARVVCDVLLHACLPVSR